MKKRKLELICGESKEIFYNKSHIFMDIILVKDYGTPLLVIYTGKKKSTTKKILTLHIKEAIELKSIIDKLVLDYLEEKIEDKWCEKDGR